jgi:hypothetical protein
MILLLTFVVLFITGQIANVAISIGVEQFSKPAGLAVFFLLFAVVAVGGWQLALRIADRLTGASEPGRSR